MAKKTLELLTEGMFYLLMSLLPGEKCGAEIAAFAAEKTGGRVTLGPGTLYTLLSRFAEEGLICETTVEGRRRSYAITERGRALYGEEYARLCACVRDAESMKGGEQDG